MMSTTGLAKAPRTKRIPMVYPIFHVRLLVELTPLDDVDVMSNTVPEEVTGNALLVTIVVLEVVISSTVYV